jgi:hypothetical protein
VFGVKILKRQGKSSVIGVLLSKKNRLLAPANINARISHLAESESAALENAHAAAGAAAGRQRAAKELLRCEIPEGQSLERYQYRTHLRRVAPQG